jgi:two-component system, NtrC family, sensor histidine kinase AtoS
MKFRANLILSIFLLVVTPIVITGFVTMEAAGKVFESQALVTGHPLNPERTEIFHLRENIIYILIIGTVVSLSGAGIFTSELSRSVNKIKQGLDALSHDTNISIDSQRGVLGEIAASINQLAEKLRETKSHRDALLESSPNGIISIDKKGKIILFNPAASLLMGISQEKALGTTFLDLNIALSIRNLITTTLNSNRNILAKEEFLMRPDGNSMAVAVSTTSMHDYHGDLIGVLAIIIDLREKRLLEAQVLRANRLAGLGELAAGMAHEIRNPLTAVKGYAQVLEDELESDDPKREYTGVIVKEVNRLDRIVQELLAFARPSASHFEMSNLNEVIEETLVLIENSDFKHQIQLCKDYGYQVEAEVDRGQMKQILLNLFLNASQAIADEGTIQVITQREDSYVAVSIIDTGIGIAEGNLDKLFDPFFTTREKGTGLGLAIAHQLMELHGGKIEVHSSIEVGTEFKLLLPMKQGGDVDG